MPREVKYVEPWPALIEGPSRAVLLREVGRAFRAGELAATGVLTRQPSGRWAVPVLRLKDAPVVPAWRRPALVAGGVVLTLSAAGAAGWYLVTLTAAAAGAASLPLIVGGAAVLLGVRLMLRRSSGDCTITITHRRH